MIIMIINSKYSHVLNENYRLYNIILIFITKYSLKDVCKNYLKKIKFAFLTLKINKFILYYLVCY